VGAKRVSFGDELAAKKGLTALAGNLVALLGGDLGVSLDDILNSSTWLPVSPVPAGGEADQGAPREGGSSKADLRNLVALLEILCGLGHCSFVSVSGKEREREREQASSAPLPVKPILERRSRL